MSRRAAVVGVAEHDDGGPAGRRAGDLDGVLDGLGAGGEQCRLLRVVAGGQAVQRSGDVDEALVLGDQEAGVGEALGLLADPAHYGGVGRADAGDSDAGGEVDDVVAVDVDEDAAAGALDEDRHGDAEPVRRARAVAAPGA